LRHQTDIEGVVVNRKPDFAAACVLLAALLMIPVQAQSPAESEIAPLPESRWSESVQAAAADFLSTGMRNLAATYANRAEVAEASLPHLAYLWTASVLPPRDRALLSLRTAWLTNSEYLWAHRAGLALREGLADADLVRIAQGPNADGWSEFDRLLLVAADEMHIDSFVSDPTWAGLSERYSTAQMIDTIDTAGALTMHAGAARIEIGVSIAFGPARKPRLVAFITASLIVHIRKNARVALGCAPRSRSRCRRSSSLQIIDRIGSHWISLTISRSTPI
jgi:alkylhydroperoxidase family enzyme